MIHIPNYKIRTQLDERAHSLVYRAIREMDNQPVILKVLKKHYPTPEELARYRQEYEISKSLNIKYVVKTYGIEKYKKTLVMILEDFGGESLKTALCSQSKPPKEQSFKFTLSVFFPVAIQIADALGQIHAASVIHKDINPSNIVWNKTTEQLKIIDFWISSRLPREKPTLKNPEQLEGTLAYISPEQTGRMNRALDYRTDLYSLGVTFYELLTGQLPFDSFDPLELVHCHLAKIPVPVCQLNPNIPVILSDIVMKLMAKNAEDRYQSALGVKIDLEKCLEQLLHFKHLDDFSFELAKKDFSGKLQIPQKLYGREDEIQTLLHAFERVSAGAREMMLVAGYSGVGKTALVHEVHKPMTLRNGYFAAGKFEQFQRNIPYSALTQAFNGFCRYLLTESVEILKQWRTQIKKAVGNNGQVLIDLIPELELVIGPQPPVLEVGPTEAQNRFNFFFQNFFRAIGQKNHPLILFIDDLQWADSASLNLLKRLMNDTENQYFLIIGAYRNNEVDATHPLRMMLENLQQNEALVNSIALDNLSRNDVNTLISEALICEANEVEGLTALVYEKTQGNAFFTHEFLKSLFDQSLLTFDLQTQIWQWEIDKIARLNMSSNVVELMSGKLNQLSVQTLEMVKLAACIGNSFDLKTLSLIGQILPSEALSHLWPAIEEGLIFSLDESYKQVEVDELSLDFKFQHDRIQQAAYALIAETDKLSLHLQIGRFLKASTSPIDAKLFEIVDHLYLGLPLITDQIEKNEMARLALMAGKKAKWANAYGPAVNYLKLGLNLLPNDCWETEYALTLDLYLATVEAEYLNTQYEKAERLSHIVLQHAKTILDQFKAYEIQMQMCIAQNKMQASIEIGLQVLEMLGVPLVNSPPPKRTMVEFEQLPNMSDPHKLAAMSILMNLFAPGVIAQPKLLPSIAFTMVTLCIRYGNSPLSAFAYVFYGMLLCSLAEIETGYQFGKLALKLLDKFEALDIKSKVYNLYYAFIFHWKKPPSLSIEPLSHGVQVGLEIGDIEYACYNALGYSMQAPFVGQPLEALSEKISAYLELSQNLKQAYQVNTIGAWGQFLHNLIGKASDKYCLTGALFNEAEMLPIFKSMNNLSSQFYVYVEKSILSYLFKDYKGAVMNASLASSNYEHATAALMVFAIHNFYYSLALLAHCSSKDQQEDSLKQVESNQKQMQRWADHAPQNYQHWYDLVEAEKARILGDILQAESYYEKAIEGSKVNQYFNEQALIYELAAEFYLGRGMAKFAQTYMREAHYYYQQWGALAKIENLESRYPQWFDKTSLFPEVSQLSVSKTTLLSTSSKAGAEWLDLNSLMKAAQTLSGEIVLSHLLEKMMRIVIENAGAESGFLLLPQQEGWYIEAEGRIDSDQVNVLQSFPISHKAIAESIIHYVIHTQQYVVLNNASQEGEFIHDAYIVKHSPKSLLCLPLINQGQLIGILYLENNLTTAAFTTKRLEVLKVLCSQLAISIENALLYRTLEEKVEERTAQLAMRTEQLAQANQEITTLNTQLQEDNLRMSAELDISRHLQQMLLPKEEELAQIEELDIAGFMVAADEVGGDYYDVLEDHGQVLFGMGDVTGHGLESGALAIMVQSAIRTLLALNETDPVKFFSALNQMVYQNVKRMKTQRSLTLILVYYQNHQLYLSGQHEEVIVVRDGQLALIDTLDLGFPIGLDKNIAEFVNQMTLPLKAGDVVVLYTDGITEAENMAGGFYGTERLCEVIRQTWQKTASEIQQAVINDVRQFIGEQKVYDDMTLLVLKQK
jgi:predicted ATPase/serine phosphatase RsbU (regulator of sigma subunit)/tRNA A-37 threonylcarbamoyl transferase component Bud32